MSYEQIKDLSPPEFKRLCGVHIATSGRMVEVLKPELVRTGKKGGQPKLSVEDHLLIALEYWPEYRTYFHLDLRKGTPANAPRVAVMGNCGAMEGTRCPFHCQINYLEYA